MKINFMLSKKADAEGKREIILRANKKTTNGRVVTLRAKSHVRTLAGFFDSNIGIDVNKKRGVPIDERKFQLEQRKKLEGILISVSEAETLAIEHKIEIKKDWLENVVSQHLHCRTKVDKDFYSLMRQYCEKQHFSDIQIKHLHVIMRDVKRFETYVRLTDKKRRDYSFSPSDITQKDIEEWLKYLRQENDLLGRNRYIAEKVMTIRVEGISAGHQITEVRGRNTMVKRANRMKSFFRWLCEKEIIQKNPFVGIKIGTEKYGNVIYPTLEERNILYKTAMPSKKMEIVRDAFVLQSVLGCRIGDLFRVSERNITNDVLIYTPHKTKDETSSTAFVPINPLAQEIIERYRGMDKDGRLMPFPSLQYINRKLKEIFKLAGITRNVEVLDPHTGENITKSIADCASTHMARRCFIGNAYKYVSDPNIICKMSGHVEGSKSFARYRNIDIDMLKAVTKHLDVNKANGFIERKATGLTCTTSQDDKTCQNARQ